MERGNEVENKGETRDGQGERETGGRKEEVAMTETD